MNRQEILDRVCFWYGHVWDKRKNRRQTPAGHWKCMRCGKRRRARRNR